MSDPFFLKKLELLCRGQYFAFAETRKLGRMDVAWHVIKQLKQQPYDGPPIHSVAVDEVQDLAQPPGFTFYSCRVQGICDPKGIRHELMLKEPANSK